jgi:hypothetical protein
MGLRRTLVAAGIGAALAYFLDPVSGRERRDKFTRFVDETVRKGAGNLGAPWGEAEDGSVPVAEPKRERPTVTN